ncbi:MAG: ATP-binding protein [Endomicrobiia bacterium]|nr:ATP-binding protein [Endomicrobiia bacterium]
MIKRRYWLNLIEGLWKERSVLLLSGVRRAGKTVLSRTLRDVDYYDCELPRIRGLMADPEEFLEKRKGKRVVLDEIHRLDNPSELLKIAADHYPGTKILATGSSAIGASAKFRDTLTGRKAQIWLTPLVSDDLRDFRKTNLAHRFLFGGLPPLFLSKKLPEKYFQEWIDAYWAKDIQELFRLERRSSFQKFLELLMVQSGGIFEASKFAAPCGVSHTTIANYLRVLEETYVAHVLKPYSTYKNTEIVAAPKVYMFDTGFVSYYRGWHDLNPKHTGQMWEHFVLNELYAHMQSRQIRYWRDKQGHEVGFIVERRGRAPVAVEAKWSQDNCDLSGLRVFLRQYPAAKAYVVANDIVKSAVKKMDKIKVTFTGLGGLLTAFRRSI